MTPGTDSSMPFVAVSALISGNRHKRRHRAPWWRQSPLGGGANVAGRGAKAAGRWRQCGWAVAPMRLGGGANVAGWVVLDGGANAAVVAESGKG
eukprot:COSAG02_NODE_1799_length_10896_cov_8.648421_8_plen_94_part_00